MKEFNFEIYVKNPITLESGWDIQIISVSASSYDDAVNKIKSYPNFDTIIGYWY